MTEIAVGKSSLSPAFVAMMLKKNLQASPSDSMPTASGASEGGFAPLEDILGSAPAERQRVAVSPAGPATFNPTPLEEILGSVPAHGLRAAAPDNLGYLTATTPTPLALPQPSAIAPTGFTPLSAPLKGLGQLGASGLPTTNFPPGPDPLVERAARFQLSNDAMRAITQGAQAERGIGAPSNRQVAPTLAATRPSPAAVASARSSSLPGNVDWNFIVAREGGSHRQGYVPQEYRQPSPSSGVTIGAGFDLGNRTPNELRNLGLSNSLVTTLTPYLGLRWQAAQDYLNASPLNVTPAQEDEINLPSFNYHYNTIANSYNRSQTTGTRFEDLPADAQTPIVSVAY